MFFLRVIVAPMHGRAALPCEPLTASEADGSLRAESAAPRPRQPHDRSRLISGEDTTMAGGRAFKSNVRERREAERRMKAMEKRRRKEEKKRKETELGPVAGKGPAPAEATLGK